MKRKWYIIFLASIVLVLIAFFNIFKYYCNYKKESIVLKSIEKEKFDTLYKINSDVVGFIQILMLIILLLKVVTTVII